MNNYERADCNLLQIHDKSYIEGYMCIEYTKGTASIRYVKFENDGETFYCEATPVSGLRFDDRWVWSLDASGYVAKLNIGQVIEKLS